MDKAIKYVRKMSGLRRYKFVEHTADVEFIAFGKDNESCFKNALMAMFDTMSYIDKVVSSKSKNVAIIIKDKAKNIEDLLWYALQDTLSITDANSIFAYKISSLKIKESNGLYTINIRIYGKNKADNLSKLDVKGVSRYNLGIKRTAKGVEATAVLDV